MARKVCNYGTSEGARKAWESRRSGMTASGKDTRATERAKATADLSYARELYPKGKSSQSERDQAARKIKAARRLLQKQNAYRQKMAGDLPGARALRDRNYVHSLSTGLGFQKHDWSGQHTDAEQKKKRDFLAGRIKAAKIALERQPMYRKAVAKNAETVENAGTSEGARKGWESRRSGMRADGTDTTRAATDKAQATTWYAKMAKDLYSKKDNQAARDEQARMIKAARRRLAQQKAYRQGVAHESTETDHNIASRAYAESGKQVLHDLATSPEHEKALRGKLAHQIKTARRNLARHDMYAKKEFGGK